MKIPSFDPTDSPPDQPNQKSTGGENPENPEVHKLNAEIKAIQKMLLYRNRPEGPISMSGRTNNQSSITIYLNTALMQVIYPKLGDDFKNSFPEINELKEINRTKVWSTPPGKLDAEVHYDVAFKVNGDLMKVKMKVYITGCKIQIQSCGPRNKFIEKMKMGHAEFFATRFVDSYVRKIIESTPDYNSVNLRVLEDDLKARQSECGGTNKTPDNIVDKTAFIFLICLKYLPIRKEMLHRYLLAPPEMLSDLFKQGVKFVSSLK